MLTDVPSVGNDEEISGGEDEDRQVRPEEDIVFRQEALNGVLSNFIPADRCLAGQNIHVRGGGERRAEGRVGMRKIFRRGIKGGHAIPPMPALPTHPPSLSLLH